MALSVQSRAEHVGTFRYIQVFLMETLARWVPRTAEMEVKVLFGRHVWDLAQQADALGKRTHELRAPLQFSLRPSEKYVNFLTNFAATAGTQEKISGFYDAFLPGLAARYERYIAATDSLLDEPTVRVIKRILGDFARMREERDTLIADLPRLALNNKEWPESLARSEAAETSIVMHRGAAAVA
jgi:hypothetical protein